MNSHPKRVPKIPEILQVLSTHGIRYVVTGSLAAKIYGVELEPRDLDITPALDKDNLNQLIEVLEELEATPEGFGHWENQPNGERKWIEEPATPEALAKWQPDPNDLSTLDHLFLTRYGNFDIVPELAGDYEILMQTAVNVNAFGVQVWVVHVDELLAKLTKPRREKDIPRVKQLREIQRVQRTKCKSRGK
jgi:hypothetical protein